MLAQFPCCAGGIMALAWVHLREGGWTFLPSPILPRGPRLGHPELFTLGLFGEGQRPPPSGSPGLPRPGSPVAAAPSRPATHFSEFI